MRMDAKRNASEESGHCVIACRWTQTIQHFEKLRRSSFEGRAWYEVVVEEVADLVGDADESLAWIKHGLDEPTDPGIRDKCSANRTRRNMNSERTVMLGKPVGDVA